jgi:GDP-L-fucose synthase
MRKDSKVFVAGHRGLVGSGIVRALRRQGFKRLILRTSAELDLRDQRLVDRFFSEEQPEYVFMCAARVGGILANVSFPARFIYDNLAIELSVIQAAFRHQVTKLAFFGSSCIYPRLATQPIPEEALLSGQLEKTNESYAIAKIAGIKLVQAYRRQYGFRGICLMPTNLYGPGDNFDLNHSHVLPALIRKFHEARVKSEESVTVWGTGKPRREFMHVDDLAAASIHLMNNWDEDGIINIGTGSDITIEELAKLIKTTVGYRGDVVFDPSKPDGTPRKLLDSNRLFATGWVPKFSLVDGIRDTYSWYLQYRASVPAA